METRKIFDINGVWLVNKAQYAFVDPTNGCRFDPNVPTQAVHTDWIKSQPTMGLWEDPAVKAKDASDAPAKAVATAVTPSPKT